MNRHLLTSARHLLRCTLVGAVLVGGGQLAAVPATAVPLTAQTLVIELPTGADLQRVPGGPTWSVVTKDGNTAETTPVITVDEDSTGVCAATGLELAFLTGGTCEVEVHAPGDDTHTPSDPVTVPAFTVTAPTTVTLTGPTVPPLAKETASLTATVTADAGTTAPTGSVEVRDLGTDLADADDDVVVATLPLVPGPGLVSAPATSVEIVNPTATARTYDARYLPDTSDHGADVSDPVTVTSQPRGLDIGVVITAPDPATVNQPSTVTVTARDAEDDSPVQPSAATLSIGGTSITLSTWDDGVATGHYSPGTAGTQAVALAFTPVAVDVYDAPTVTTSVHVVDDTVTTLTTDDSSPLAKEKVTLTATVTGTGTAGLDGVLTIIDVGDDLTLDTTDDSTAKTHNVATTSPTVTDTVEVDVHNDSATERRYVAVFTPAATGPTGTHRASSSASLSVTSEARPTTVDVDVSPHPAVIGESSTITVTATDTTSHGSHVVAPAPGSTITIGAETIALDWSTGAGIATFEADGTPGDRAVSVAFASGGAYADPTGALDDLRVVDDTETTIQADEDEPLAQEKIELTATVENTTGSTTPTGTVGFYVDHDDNPATPETLLGTETLTEATAGTATATLADVTSSTAGTRSYTARYTPVSTPQTHAATGTTAPKAVDYQLRPTTATLDVADLPVTAGRTHQVTVTVTDAAATTTKVQPTTDTLTIGTQVVDLDWTDGVGTGSYIPDTSGTETVSLAFTPAADDLYAAPTSALGPVVVIDDTETTIQASDDEPLVQEKIDLVATVENTTGSTTPTGTVRFYVDHDDNPATPETLLGTETLTEDTTGSATATYTPVTAATTGVRNYTAHYDPTDAGTAAQAHAATDTTTAQAVDYQPRPYGIKVRVTAPNPGVVDRTSTVTVTVTDAADADRVIAPDEDATTLTIGGVEVDLDWDASDGPVTATGTFKPGTTGANALAVTYVPVEDDVYDAPTIDAPTLRVIHDTTTTLAVDTATPLMEDDATLTATVTNATGTDRPAGAVQFYLDGDGDLDTIVDQTPVGVPVEVTESVLDATSEAETTVVPLDAIARTYVARFVPADLDTDAHLYAASRSGASSITGRLRSATVQVTAPTADQAVNDDQTVTVTVADSTNAAKRVYGSATVRINDGTAVTVAFSAAGVAEFPFTPTTVGPWTIATTVTLLGEDDVASYQAQTITDRTFTVKKVQSPTATLSRDGSPYTGVLYAGTTITVGATGSHGALSLAHAGTTTAADCTISGLVVTLVRESTCDLKLLAAGTGSDDYYFPATVDLSLPIVARVVDVALALDPQSATYGDLIKATGTATDRLTGSTVAGTGTISWTKRVPPGETAPTGQLSYTFGDGAFVLSRALDAVAGPATMHAGDYDVTVTFQPTAAQDELYAPAVSTARHLVIAQAPQEITTAPVPDVRNVGDTYVAAPTRGGSGNPVLRTVSTPSVCDVDPEDDATIVFKTVGTCTLRYNQAGNDDYLAAPEHEVTFTVNAKVVKLTPATVSAPLGLTYESEVTVSIAATDERVSTTLVPGIATTLVERTTSTPAAEPVPDGVLTTAATDHTATLVFAPKKLVAGHYRVTFTFTPTDSVNFQQQTKVVEFDIVVAAQTVVLSSLRPQPVTAEVTTAWKPSFVSTQSGLPVAVTPKTATSTPEDLPDYDRLPVTDTVNGTTTIITAPTTSCGPKSGAADTVEFLAQGTCRIRAEVAADPGRYSAEVVEIVVPVRRIQNTLHFVPPPATAKVDDELSVRAFVRDSRSRPARGAGDFSISRVTSAGPPAILEELPETSGDVLTQEWFGGGRFANFLAEHAGSYRVSARFDPINPVVFAPAADTTAFTIAKAPQVITQADPPSDRKVRQDWTTDPVGGASPEPVRLVVDGASAAVCHVDPVKTRILRFDSAGNCRYSFVQDGTADYEPDVLGPLDITVTQTATHLSLAVPTDARVGVETTITATALADGAAVKGTVGTITVTTANGAHSAVPAGVTSTWVDGVGTLRFVPTLAGTAAKPLKVTATFVPADGPAFALPTDATSDLVVGTGIHEVVVPTDRALTAFVDEEWTPGERAGGNLAGSVLTSVADSDPGACTRDSGTGRIRFEAPGTCRVRMTMAHIDGPDADSPQTWAAAPERIWDIEVSSHPLQLLLATIPTERLYYENDIPVEVQLVGDRGRGPERVTGQVTFWVDGVALPGSVAVDAAGKAATTITFHRAAGEDASDQHSIRVSFAPDNVPVPHLWAAIDRTFPQTVRRTTQTISADPNFPATMAVGQVWTPTLRADPSNHPVVVSAGPASVCRSNDGRSVTAVGAGPGLPDCQVRYSVLGDTKFAPVAVEGPTIGTALRAATVTVDDLAGPIARPIGLTATVAVPSYPASGAAGTGLTVAPAEAPEGTVTFRLDDDAGTVISGVALEDGIATTTYTPLTAAEPVRVTAEFVPAHPERHAAGATGQAVLSVSPVSTGTTVSSVTATSIGATVTPEYAVRAPVGGVVDFSWSPVGVPGEVHPLGSAPVEGGVARIGAVPPADRAVVIIASYGGGDDHGESIGSYDRLLPRIEAAADRDLTGWSRQSVTVSFTCAATSAPVVGGCPGAQVFTRDGGGQQASASIVAADGGTAGVSLGGIRIDRTDPTVRITGVKATPYAGDGPDLACEAGDALTAATCAITTKPAVVPGDYDGVVEVTATATDEAGNTSQATASYELVQQWIEGRAPGGPPLVVKRGKAFKLFVRTAGPRPQLMLPVGKTYQPGPGFRAVSARDGMVTWTLRYRISKKLRPAVRGWLAYRLAGRPIATSERLPVRLVSGSARSR